MNTIAANGSGWGFRVAGSQGCWTVKAPHGGDGMIGLRDPSGEWLVSDRARTRNGEGTEERVGDVVVAAVTPPAENAMLARSAPWIFVYEGTITRPRELANALDPNWIVSAKVAEKPGTLIFAHLLTYLTEVNRVLTANEAMAKGVADLRRARPFGSMALLCSNGQSLYAFALARSIRIANVGDSIVVGSPEVMQDVRVTQGVPNASLLAVQKQPQLGWAIVDELGG